jgi:general stress protein CsbA
MIPHMLALLGNVVLWVTYVFAAICLALLVYAASQGGAEVATWAITLSVCAAAIVIGFLIQYILVGNRKA